MNQACIWKTEEHGDWHRWDYGKKPIILALGIVQHKLLLITGKSIPQIRFQTDHVEKMRMRLRYQGIFPANCGDSPLGASRYIP